jgi:hypothetical protein
MIDFEQQKQQAQVYQSLMMKRFKETEEFAFLQNLMEAKRLSYAKERQKMMRLASTRDNVLYFTGKEDSILEFFESINQTIVDGEEILENRRQTANRED